MKEGLCGAMVARLTPDQKAVCSNHIRVKVFKNNFPFFCLKTLQSFT